jgi:hypothetical protein
MADSKHLRWTDTFSTDAAVQSEDTTATLNTNQPAANDADGWKHYREWITKAPAPRVRRSGIDPTLYTWRGYRNWSEKIRRNWRPDSDDD